MMRPGDPEARRRDDAKGLRGSRGGLRTTMALAVVTVLAAASFACKKADSSAGSAQSDAGQDHPQASRAAAFDPALLDGPAASRVSLSHQNRWS